MHKQASKQQSRPGLRATYFMEGFLLIPFAQSISTKVTQATYTSSPPIFFMMMMVMNQPCGILQEQHWLDNQKTWGILRAFREFLGSFWNRSI